MSNEEADPEPFFSGVNQRDLKGKVALVTGGAHGIGAAVTRALAKAGVFVTIADIDAEAGQKFAYILMKEGLRASFVKTDVTNWASQASTFERCIKSITSGRIDIIVTCVGVNDGDTTYDTYWATTKDPTHPQPPPWRAFVDTNLLGSYNTAAVARRFARRTDAFKEQFTNAEWQLILVAPTVTHSLVPLHSIYSVSRMALRALWQSLRSSPDLTGLRASLVAPPHSIRTPMSEAKSAGWEDNDEQRMVAGGVAAAVLAVASDNSIKGRALQVTPQGGFIDMCDNFDAYDGVTYEISQEEVGYMMQSTPNENEGKGKRKRDQFSSAALDQKDIPAPKPRQSRPKPVSRPSGEDIRKMYAFLHDHDFVMNT